MSRANIISIVPVSGAGESFEIGADVGEALGGPVGGLIGAVAGAALGAYLSTTINVTFAIKHGAEAGSIRTYKYVGPAAVAILAGADPAGYPGELLSSDDL